VADLDGAASSYDLGSGISITAPGVVGTVDLRPSHRYIDVAEPPVLTEDPTIDRVLSSIFDSRFVLDARLSLDGGTSATIAMDAPTSGSAVLVVADPGDGGVVTFHPPDQHPDTRALLADEVDSAHRLTFTIPASRLANPSPSREGQVDLFLPAPMRKVVALLVHEVAAMTVSAAVGWLADRWEDKHRPYGLKQLLVGEPGKSTWTDFPVARWPELAGKKTLLFVHGIFSTVESAFAGLDGIVSNDPDETTPYQVLAERYDLLVGFNHPTASVDPIENAKELHRQVGSDVVPTVDVLCHSRGGLVARLIAGEKSSAAPGSVIARKIVFAGTPNAGTVLVEPDNLKHLINRFVNLLRWIPPGPWSAARADVEGFLHLVKFLGVAVEEGLPGLVYMSPGNMTKHNAGCEVTGGRLAIGANFEPSALARHLLDSAEDHLVFSNVDNDVAVPTDLVNEGETPPLILGPGGTWHGTYFKDPVARAQLLTWLEPSTSTSDGQA
jgi:hypothetical protein